MTDRERLLHKIQMHDFMLYEVSLYLDTHKCDKEALCFYQKHKEDARKMTKEYVEKYGPLVISDSNSDHHWEWSDGPWPWEYAAN